MRWACGIVGGGMARVWLVGLVLKGGWPECWGMMLPELKILPLGGLPGLFLNGKEVDLAEVGLAESQFENYLRAMERGQSQEDRNMALLDDVRGWPEEFFARYAVIPLAVTEDGTIANS